MLFVLSTLSTANYLTHVGLQQVSIQRSPMPFHMSYRIFSSLPMGLLYIVCSRGTSQVLYVTDVRNLYLGNWTVAHIFSKGILDTQLTCRCTNTNSYLGLGSEFEIHSEFKAKFYPSNYRRLILLFMLSSSVYTTQLAVTNQLLDFHCLSIAPQPRQAQ